MIKLDDRMAKLAYDLINADNEPTRRALAYLRAVEQHLNDLREDEPVDESEGFNTLELAQAYSDVRAAVHVINNMYKRLRKS